MLLAGGMDSASAFRLSHDYWPRIQSLPSSGKGPLTPPVSRNTPRLDFFAKLPLEVSQYHAGNMLNGFRCR